MKAIWKGFDVAHFKTFILRLSRPFTVELFFFKFNSPSLHHSPSHSPGPRFLLFAFIFLLSPSTSDLTKKLCTAPHNEVRLFQMLMLLLTAQCTTQGT